MTTTIKIQEATKSHLDAFREEGDSYDRTIARILSRIRKANLKDELKEAYKQLAERDSRILKEWEVSSKEVVQD